MLFQGTDPEKDRKYLWCGSERTAREGAVKLLFPHGNMFSRSLTSSSSSSPSSPPHHLQHPQHPQQFDGCFLCVSHISQHASGAFSSSRVFLSEAGFAGLKASHGISEGALRECQEPKMTRCGLVTENVGLIFPMK